MNDNNYHGVRPKNLNPRQAATLEEQRQFQDRIRSLEKKKRRQRQEIFDVEDEIIKKEIVLSLS